MFDETALRAEVNRRYKQLYSDETMSPFAELMIKQNIRMEVKIELLTKQLEAAEKEFLIYKQRLQDDGE